MNKLTIVSKFTYQILKMYKIVKQIKDLTCRYIIKYY